MFGIDKDLLCYNINKIQKDVCAYGQDCRAEIMFCDCKYGKEEDQHHNPLHERFSGCCELTMIYRLLNVMSEEEYIDLCDRAGIK